MIKVTEKIWRGRRPRDLRELMDHGFQRVVVLQSGDEDKFTDSLYEAQLAAKRADKTLYPSIDVVYIRCSNILPPTDAQVDQFLASTGDGKKLYVHCHSGVDRTGFMVAAYKMNKLSQPFTSVYTEWVELGRHWWFDWWKYSLKEWGKS